MNIRKILMVASVLIMPVTGMAFDKGIKAGVNIANASIDVANAPSTDAITGLTAGAFISLGLGPIELEPNLLFTAKGYGYDDVSGGVTTETVNNFSYIEIPILVKWMIIPVGPVKPYLGAGPSFGFLMSAEAKSTIAGVEDTADIKEFMKGTDMSAVLTAGVRFGLAVVSLHAEVRYAIGLSDISDGGAYSLKNNVVSIIAGIGF